MPEEVIIFPINVELGKFYKVPCILNLAGGLVPINSYLHNDKKIIGVDFRHWHIDWRFVNAKFYQQELVGRNETWPISAREVGFPLVYYTIPPHDVYLKWASNTTKIHYRTLKCKRNYSAGKFFTDRFDPINDFTKRMESHFRGSKLKQVDGVLICPHKGVHIDTNCKDENGNYVCPGHLLRFNPKTLKCVKPQIKKHKHQ